MSPSHPPPPPLGLRVHGETGWLRRVLVCAPGEELRRVPPSERDKYLMEDVLWLERAVTQHQSFTRVLGTLMAAAPGGEHSAVLDLRKELVRAIRASGTDALAAFISGVCRADGLLRGSELDGVEAELAAWGQGDPARLADRLLGGLLIDKPFPGGPVFRLGPSPNALFARDYQFVVGGVAFISSMAKPVRRKEPALSHFVFEHALGLGGSAVPIAHIEPLSEQALRHLDAAAGETWIEGGDVMVLSQNTVLVGISERTTWRGATALALALRRLRQHDPVLFPFRELCAVEMPARRAMMHLDTVFTMVDEGLALAFPPLTFPGAREEMSVVSCDLVHEPEAPLTWVWRGAFSRAMAERLSSPGKPLTLLAAGGANRRVQQREQWFDACNAVATGPGIAVVYKRNDATLDVARRLDDPALRKEEVIVAPGAKRIPEAHLRPFEIVLADQVTPRKAAQVVESRGRMLACIDGGELGRARGGPHCMTMALTRG